MSYEDYIKSLEGGHIDNVDWKCPKCGGDMDFNGDLEEEYREDGTFMRLDDLECVECGCVVTAKQVYTPGKLTVEIEE